MNRTILVGRLTKDVNLKYTQSGKAVANFTLAVNRPFKNANGDQEADFIQCQSWGKQAENLANYMGKGSQVGVDGRIQTRNYENDQGQRVYVTEVVADSVQFLESKNKANTDVSNQSGININENRSNDQQGAKNNQREPLNIDDSDLPF